MPRSKSHVPTYRLHKPTGKAVVTIAGRDHYLGAHGSPASHAEYDRLIAEWMAAGRGAVVERAPDLTVSEVLDAYWQHARHRPNPFRAKAAMAPARALYGDTPAAHFSGPALKACRVRLVLAGHCRGHVNQLVEALRRAFTWAVGEDLVPPEVAAKLAAVEGLRAGEKAGGVAPPEGERVRPADLGHVRAAQAQAQPAASALIELQLLTGCRPGEAVILRPCDVDRSEDVWVYRPVHHKTAHLGKQRTVWMGPKAQAVLLPWLDRLPGDWCFDSTEAEMRRRLLLGQKTGGRGPRAYAVSSYSRAVRAACGRAGVPCWHPHQLRHTAATFLVAEFGWDVARIILGHSSLSVTKVYAEDAHHRAADAMRRAG